jgi:hypothetical protein
MSVPGTVWGRLEICGRLAIGLFALLTATNPQGFLSLPLRQIRDSTLKHNFLNSELPRSDATSIVLKRRAEKRPDDNIFVIQPNPN